MSECGPGCPCGGRRVLVVADEAEVQRLAARLEEQLGEEVVYVSPSPDEKARALAKAERDRAPDLDARERLARLRTQQNRAAQELRARQKIRPAPTTRPVLGARGRR